MVSKKKTTKQHQRELIGALQTRNESSSDAPLVQLTIARPEPLLAGAQRVLERVQALKVDSPDSYTEAANMRTEIRAEHDAMEARRVKMKAPTLQAGRDIDAFFNPAIDTLADALETLGSLMSSYDAAQRRIAQEKQRAAEAEAKRVREEAERRAREERERTQMAMSEIQGINQQVIIATMGRAGVRKGHTLECIRETLAETEKWDLEAHKERFGTLYDAAVKAKATAIDSIKALEAQFIAKQEQARLAAEQAAAKAAGDAEALRLSQVEATAARQAMIEARKAQLRAEQEAQKAKDAAAQAAAASVSEAELLEQKAVTTVAPKIEADLVQVAGLSRPKVWKWKIVDKAKLKPEFLLVDEKTINRLVSTAKERAHAMVGEGAIEIYQEEGLRQDR